MKDFFHFCSELISQFFAAETHTASGKVNLAGGVLLILMAVAASIHQFFTDVINICLSFWGKSLPPLVSEQSFLVSLVIIGSYFLLCVRAIWDDE
jgi:hypothetical protein